MVLPVECPVCGLRYHNQAELEKHLRFNRDNIFHKIQKPVKRRFV